MLLCLRDALRSGDVPVPGSRRFADPTAYLITAEAWPAQRAEFCALVDVPADPAAALAPAKAPCAATICRPRPNMPDA